MTQEIHSLDAADLNPTEMYLLLRDAVIPRPIAWVSSVDVDGRSNLAPYSFFNVCSNVPPVLGFAVGPRGKDKLTGALIEKDTLANIKATGELVVNIVPEELIEPMVRTATGLEPGEDEFAFAGLTQAPSEKVRPGRVLGAPVAFECRLFQIVEVGTHHWVMGEIVRIHIDERIYVGAYKGLNHRVDPLRVEALRPVGRLGRAYYTRLREIDTILRSDASND
ncbi:MAG: flavin reductase family protein [Burkholderiaceae bacterium]|nr:flavin reductase family protein [Burkholderiaceae bacterium]